MLPNLLLNFTEYFQPLNIFNYISFRTIGALLTALLISFIFGEKIIFEKSCEAELTLLTRECINFKWRLVNSTNYG